MGFGILSKQEMARLNPSGPARHCIIRPSGEPLARLLDKSALDLPLGDEFWVMKGSCRTGKGLNVRDVIRDHSHDPKPSRVEQTLRLERNTVYLFKLDCSLDLRDTKIQGKSTARSSIGRLDMLVRLLADGALEFDRVQEDYHGDLYVEVTPITFDILVRPGTCLSQLRLFRGSERIINLSQEMLDYEDPYPVVDAQGDELRHRGDDVHDVVYPFALDLTPDPRVGFAGFVAKKEPTEPIDPTLKQHYEPREFWDDIRPKDNAMALAPDRLYILRSKERLRLPGHIALECQAYTETMGEWRIEYAGFAHPWFGSSRDEGTPLIFEVRGHTVPTILTDGIPLGNVCFKRMSQAPPKPVDEKAQGEYEDQELQLSSCFKPWPTQES